MMKFRLSTSIGLAAVLATAAFAGEHGTVEEAKAMLDRAVKLVESEGEAKAIAAFNDPDGPFRDRDLYVFCMDKSHKITAHPSKDMRGTDVTALEDPDGKPIGKEMAALVEKGGGQIEYRWENPVSKKIEHKISFLKTAGDQACGVGAYK